MEKKKEKTSSVNDRVLSLPHFLASMKESCKNGKRFCFILGSGASVESGIPMGLELEKKWMEQLPQHYSADLPGVDAQKEIQETAEKLGIDYQAIRKEYDEKKSLSSKYYFDLYKLRFYPNAGDGYKYLEKIMENKQPSFGYYPLVKLLTDREKYPGNNLVITTNFDSLVEDALFIYTEQKPLVINHEVLADFMKNNLSRPVIAKIHRGLFFDPFNRPEEVGHLPEKWRPILQQAFRNYTPVVIGYGGGDNSLMEFFKNASAEELEKIYWCYLDDYGLPQNGIRDIIEQHNGYFVKTDGFDSMMFMLGEALYQDDDSYHDVERYIRELDDKRIKEYGDQRAKLMKKYFEKPVKDESESQIYEVMKQSDARELQALKEKEELIGLEADDYFRMAKIFERANLDKNVIESYTKAIELDPKEADYYNNRGMVYEKLEEYKKALEDYNQAIELNPKEAFYYNNRGYVYKELKEYEKALENYNQAIELDPKESDYYNSRGFLYGEMGEYKKSLNEHIKTIELKSSDPVYHNNLGWTYFKLNNFEKAFMFLKNATYIDPRYANPYNHRGKIYFIQKKYDEALWELTKAIELKPEYTEAYQNRAEVYKALGKEKEAQADLLKAKELEKQLKKGKNP